MRKTANLLVCILLCSACRPSVDRSDSQEAIAESGAIGGRPSKDGDPIAKGAENVTLEALPANNLVAPEPPDDAAADAGNQAGNAVAVEALTPSIPVRYHGRWGMVPADCEPGRSDAKGLLTIGDKTLRFYESVGTLKEQRVAIATAFSALYHFTGEGMAWDKVITLTREGDRLTRAEDAKAFRYTRCA
ncbi:hypothetical protein ACFQPG_08135 [Sphingomonas sp. GCM10030256]|uniref:hypothetical protein n=1 Tax=Sphingomonas sp. GCM10030256 TaxID=3273427 RepID=UPI003609ACDA